MVHLVLNRKKNKVKVIELRSPQLGSHQAGLRAAGPVTHPRIRVSPKCLAQRVEGPFPNRPVCSSNSLPHPGMATCLLAQHG